MGNGAAICLWWLNEMLFFPTFTQNWLKNYCIYSKNADFWADSVAVGNQLTLHPAHPFFFLV
jgi:hypothetical protein